MKTLCFIGKMSIDKLAALDLAQVILGIYNISIAKDNVSLLQLFSLTLNKNLSKADLKINAIIKNCQMQDFLL